MKKANSSRMHAVGHGHAFQWSGAVEPQPDAQRVQRPQRLVRGADESSTQLARRPVESPVPMYQKKTVLLCRSTTVSRNQGIPPLTASGTERTSRT